MLVWSYSQYIRTNVVCNVPFGQLLSREKEREWDRGSTKNKQNKTIFFTFSISISVCEFCIGSFSLRPSARKHSGLGEYTNELNAFDEEKSKYRKKCVRLLVHRPIKVNCAVVVVAVFFYLFNVIRWSCDWPAESIKSMNAIVNHMYVI